MRFATNASRGSALVVIALALAVLVFSSCGETPPASRTGARPHVVIFLADDLGLGDVGYLGSEIPTPNIDRLARNGLILDRFYTEPYCTPSRAALLTGRSPIRYGLSSSVLRPWSTAGLPPSELLLSEVLAGAGYETALVGKWHLGHQSTAMHPNARGFDHFYGHLGGRIDYFTHQVSYRTLSGQKLGLDWQRNGVAVRKEGYATDLLGEEAARVVTEGDGEEPLFLLLSFNAPHPPLQAPPEKVDAFRGLAGSQRQVYAAMVSALDDAVGRVTRALADRGILDDTLILFLSDNGAAPGKGGSNGKLRGGKASTWEGGIRVPAFLHWPRRIRGGRRTDQLLSVLDVLPTVASAAGVKLDPRRPLDGEDLWLLIEEGETRSRKELHFSALDGELLSLATLREDWKLVREIDRRTGAKRERLFHLEDDPLEHTDVAQDHPARAAELSRSLDVWLASGGGTIDPDREDPPPGWRAPEDWAQLAR